MVLEEKNKNREEDWRLRRSLLFVPGISPKMLNKALTLPADCLIFDLEDAVAPNKKEEARGIVRNFILNHRHDFRREIIVRVNHPSTPYFKDDILQIVEAAPECILLPKIDSPEEVEESEDELEKAEQRWEVKAKTGLMLMIETVEGILNAVRIAKASKRVSALIFGAADFSREARIKLTEDRSELIYAMSHLVLAARSAKADALDAPHTKIYDKEGNIKAARLARSLGFDGKTCVHPGQIEDINEIFTPSAEEIEYAQKVMSAYNDARREGKGAISVDGNLIEELHVEIARRTLRLARLAGAI